MAKKGKKPKRSRAYKWFGYTFHGPKRRNAGIPHTCIKCGWVCSRPRVVSIINCPRCGPSGAEPYVKPKIKKFKPKTPRAKAIHAGRRRSLKHALSILTGRT